MFLLLVMVLKFLTSKDETRQVRMLKTKVLNDFFQDASLAVLYIRLHIYSIQSQQQGYCVTWKLVN